MRHAVRQTMAQPGPMAQVNLKSFFNLSLPIYPPCNVALDFRRREFGSKKDSGGVYYIS